MKKFLIMIIAILPFIFLLSCTGSKLKTDLTEKNIKGRVKKTTEREYSAVEKFGKVEKDSLKDTLVYKYDENGNSLFSDKDSYHSTDPSCKYDEKGNPIEYSIYREDGSFLCKWKLKWDDRDKMIELREYSNNDNLLRRETYIFDNKGNKIEKEMQSVSYSDPNRFLYSKYVYKYDDKDNEIGWYSEDTKDGRLSPIETYKYDGKGNKIEEKYFSNGSLSQITKYIYDNKENLIEVNLNSNDGSSSAKTIYKYDDKGNKVEETSSGTLSNEPIKWNFSYKYEYDKTGNWIKMINYKDGVLGSITEREIEYY